MTGACCVLKFKINFSSNSNKANLHLKSFLITYTMQSMTFQLRDISLTYQENSLENVDDTQMCTH